MESCVTTREKRAEARARCAECAKGIILDKGLSTTAFVRCSAVRRFPRPLVDEAGRALQTWGR